MRSEQDVIFRPDKVRTAHPRDDLRVAYGKAARGRSPRSQHANLDLRNRPDPVTLLEDQAQSRVPELVPIRYARMSVSPFTFYRGAAIVMASDLAVSPSSGLRVQLCGDAHLLNFGIFGTPERELIFDVNDFDETLPGPWEWDVKRLAASMEIAARSNDFSGRKREAIVRATVRSYRETMAELAAQGNLDVWYARLNMQAALETFAKYLTRRERRSTEKEIARSELVGSVRELAKLTDGQHHIVSRPPLLVPLREILDEAGRANLEETVASMMKVYTQSLPNDRRVLFEQYRFVELARKVVGVGSVGTRCWIALFTGIDNNDVLFLQIKEADASVLERFAGASEYKEHGHRVVAGQRLMQAASDVLLGWARVDGVDGAQRDFYIRQLGDWKGSVRIEDLDFDGLAMYGRMCGWTLARAHARSGDRAAIAGYLGTGDAFDTAIATFSGFYADQNDRDYEHFMKAIETGRLSRTSVP